MGHQAAAVLLGLIVFCTRPRSVVAYKSTILRPTIMSQRRSVSIAPVLISATEKTQLQPAEKDEVRKPMSEFELNLGRCIDALRNDFPEFFDRELQWDVYTDNIEINDPTGVQLQGLAAYKQTFGMIRLFRRLMVQDVDLTFRLRYDWGKQIIVVQWYSSWTARGTSRTVANVDAVSHFHLNKDGLIYRHDIEKIIVNSERVQPPFATNWLSFRAHLLAGLDNRVPAGVACSSSKFDFDPFEDMTILSDDEKTSVRRRNQRKFTTKKQHLGLNSFSFHEHMLLASLVPIPIRTPTSPLPLGVHNSRKVN